MGTSTAMSVGAYSVVLAESLAAVGLSTLVPAAFIASARALKATGDVVAPPSSDVPDIRHLLDVLPAGPAEGMLKLITREAESLHLLVPKTAKVRAEFEMQASETYAANASAGCNLQVMGVHVGFSGLYSTKSTTKITLDLDYAVAHFLLRAPEA